MLFTIFLFYLDSSINREFYCGHTETGASLCAKRSSGFSSSLSKYLCISNICAVLSFLLLDS